MEPQSQVTSQQLWLLFQMLTKVDSQFCSINKVWDNNDQLVIYKFFG